jgi:hypothetical protein
VTGFSNSIVQYAELDDTRDSDAPMCALEAADHRYPECMTWRPEPASFLFVQ